MTTEDSFEAMNREGLQQFEETYGTEARERYGNDAIDASNERMMNLTRDEWDAKELLEEAIKVQLRLARATDDPSSPEAAELAAMHPIWITVQWVLHEVLRRCRRRWRHRVPRPSRRSRQHVRTV